MATIPRSTDDILLDNMVAELAEFAAEQVAGASEGETVGFSVERDRIRPPSKKKIPLVNVWLASIEPQRTGASAKTNASVIARINVDCYARGMDDSTDDEDDAAMARLYYLKEQVKHGLFRLKFADCGLTAGTVSRKGWPSWALFQSEIKLPEIAVVAGRWSLEVEFEWKPEDITGTALDSFSVNAGRWAALYNYGGD